MGIGGALQWARDSESPQYRSLLMRVSTVPIAPVRIRLGKGNTIVAYDVVSLDIYGDCKCDNETAMWEGAVLHSRYMYQLSNKIR